MDLPKSKVTRLVVLVLKICPTVSDPRLGLGLYPAVAETYLVIELSISVSKIRGNHTDLAKPDLLYKFNSKRASHLVPRYPSDRLIANDKSFMQKE